MVLSSISAAESGITPFYFLYLLYLLKFSNIIIRDQKFYLRYPRLFLGL